MSLIKLAFGIDTILMPSIGTTAAMSGNPAGWLMKKIPKKKLFGFISRPSLRRNTQETTISMMSNAVNNLRNGQTQDSTRLFSGIGESFLGHSGKLAVGAAETLSKTKGISKTYNALMKEIVNKDGRINIPKVEKVLRVGKNINSLATKINKNPLTIYGGVVGAGIGAMKTPTNENTKTKNVIKGFGLGAGVGFGLKKSVNSVKKFTDPITTMNKEYFADSYWKDRLKGANKSITGPVLSNKFTAFPEDRLKRIKRFNALDQWSEDIFNKEKTKNAWHSTIDSFKTKKDPKQRTLIGSLGHKLFGKE